MYLQYYLKILFEFLYGNSIFKYITMPTNFNHSKFKLNSHCSVCFATGLMTIWAISGHLKRKISHYQIELFAIRNNIIDHFVMTPNTNNCAHHNAQKGNQKAGDCQIRYPESCRLMLVVECIVESVDGHNSFCNKHKNSDHESNQHNDSPIGKWRFGADKLLKCD